ncbi:[citrate (pro-3S)-lyase] ligase [Sedimentibacter sp.]|nr:[citrate (pro-3S)-lyase] ligase [Sedimentibacter sp.]
MSYEVFYEEFGYPMMGNKLQKLISFLSGEQLTYDEGIEFTVNLVDSKGKIAATGSLEGKILKCIAVSDSFQGEGLAAKIVTILISQALSKGYSHLFLFTKPDNINIFNDLGFYLIAKTKDAALMENIKNGISEYVNSLKPRITYADTGAIVLNCNPFTNGHLYLIETASKQCEFLHLFVVSEDKSIFPSEVRYDLVKNGVKHLNNVVVHTTSDYLISSATFPTYFIKDKFKAGNINCLLDLKIFCEYFAGILNIKKRFVGTEPFDKVTAEYNIEMKRVLYEYNIEVVEIQRLETNNAAISASLVRKLLAEGDYEKIKNMVPKTTYDFLISDEGNKIREKLRSQ